MFENDDDEEEEKKDNTNENEHLDNPVENEETNKCKVLNKEKLIITLFVIFF